MDLNFIYKVTHFGYSIAPRETRDRNNILIGAPFDGDTGSVYNCDEYGDCENIMSGLNLH